MRARTPQYDHFGKYGDIEGFVGYSGQSNHQVKREIRLLQFRLRHPTHFLLSIEPVIHGAAIPSAAALAKSYALRRIVSSSASIPSNKRRAASSNSLSLRTEIVAIMFRSSYSGFRIPVSNGHQPYPQSCSFLVNVGVDSGLADGLNVTRPPDQRQQY